LLQSNKRVTTEELSQHFQVSPCTIRNDLLKLEKEGLIRKIHGGAVFIENEGNIINFHSRERKNSNEKTEICEAALRHISNGQCIILDASSTALTLANLLDGFDRLTVITNGIYTMMALKDKPNITVIMTGGIVTKNSGSLEGLLGKDLFNEINIDIAFISAQGFSLDAGLTDFNLYEASLKKLMIQRAKTRIALLDYSKLDHVSIATFASKGDLDTIITDKKASPEIVEKYRANGLNVEIV
jgi:DeoR/GlpR family transcriptional regulator of sugar metabolism